MAGFIHIITTRFNVPTENWHRTREGKTPLTEEWHEHRFGLFHKFTFPSFKNQSCRNFIWLVFFDINTSEKYRKIIANFQSEFPNFTPVFVNHGGEINSEITKIFRKYFTIGTKFVISTDIDNDDLLHRDFVNIIQQHYRPVHNLVIDLRRGLQMTEVGSNYVVLNEFYAASNPFVSIIENVSNFKTVMNERHNNYRNYPDIVWYGEKPMFIQLIHSHNMMNRTFPTKAVWKKDFNDFGIAAADRPKVSHIRSVLHNLQRIPSLLSRILKK